MSAGVAVLEGLLGGEPYEGGPSPGFDWAQWRFADGARLELITPTGTPAFLHRFLDRRGPGVHHVTYKVDSLEAAIGRARAHGYEVTGHDTSNPHWQEAFLHPKQAQGIVVQLAQSGAEDDEPEPGGATYGGFTFPPPAPRRAPAARLIGLRLSAPSEADARRLWEATLGGSPATEGDGLRFRWPDSPLSIWTGFDADAAPGPRGLELARRPFGDWPEAPLKPLGTRLVPG